MRAVRLPKILLLAVTAGLLLSACRAFDPAAAVVDGRRVEDDAYQRFTDFLLADPRFAQQEMADNGGLEEQRAELRRQVLSFLIQQEVVDERAEERGIDVDPEEVDRLLEQQTEQVGGEEALQEQLEASDATIEDVRSLLEAQLLREAVARDIAEEEVSDEALREAYEAREAEFTTVHLSHILVRNENLAERLARQATPQNFARLARQHSQDPGSAPDGGDLGEARPTDFVEPFADAAMEIPVGEIGGPVETDFGFHVILVHERETRPLDEVRGELVEERVGQAFGEWLRDRLARADVRVNPRYGVFNPESGQVEERRATTPLPGPQVTP
jgi:parvulin-like peptidyl-prolyl isomerase